MEWNNYFVSWHKILRSINFDDDKFSLLVSLTFSFFFPFSSRVKWLEARRQGPQNFNRSMGLGQNISKWFYGFLFVRCIGNHQEIMRWMVQIAHSGRGWKLAKFEEKYCSYKWNFSTKSNFLFPFPTCGTIGRILQCSRSRARSRSGITQNSDAKDFYHEEDAGHQWTWCATQYGQERCYSCDRFQFSHGPWQRFFRQSHVGGTKGHGRTVCHQDFEEGYHYTGWWRGMHDGGKTGISAIWKASIPRSIAFMFSNHGSSLLCDGVRQWWWFDVSNSTVRKIQRASGCVSCIVRCFLRLSTWINFFPSTSFSLGFAFNFNIIIISAACCSNLLNHPQFLCCWDRYWIVFLAFVWNHLSWFEVGQRIIGSRWLLLANFILLLILGNFSCWFLRWCIRIRDAHINILI